MSFEAIAAEMGISKSRVEQIYRRGMGKVFKAIKEDPSLLEGFGCTLDDLLELKHKTEHKIGRTSKPRFQGKFIRKEV